MNEERIELTGVMAGKHIIVDVDKLTVGTIEDIQSNQMATVRGAIEGLITGGDVGPLRDLHLAEFHVVSDAVAGILNPKKAS